MDKKELPIDTQTGRPYQTIKYEQFKLMEINDLKEDRDYIIIDWLIRFNRGSFNYTKTLLETEGYTKYLDDFHYQLWYGDWKKNK